MSDPLVRVVALTPDPIDASVAAVQLRLEGCGAIVTFEGITRSPDAHGAEVTLEYEAWERRARAAMERIVDETLAAAPIRGVVAVHRIGEVGPQEPAIVVAVAAAHRGEAFDAAISLVDRIKAEVPIWKREHVTGEATWIGLPSAETVSAARPRRG